MVIYLFGLPFDENLSFPFVVIIIVVMALISIKGDEFLLNMLLTMLFIIFVIFAGYLFEYALNTNTVIVVVFDIIGSVIIGIFGAKVIIMDGIKGGWKTLKADSFKDK